MNESQPTQQWNYVALGEYDVPGAPVAEVAHKGLKKLWRHLWSGRGETVSNTDEVTQRSSIEFFDEIFLEPVWSASSPKLEELAEAHLTSNRPQVFVGGPHRCTPDMLRGLAEEKRWTVLEAPEPNEVLEGQLTLPTVAQKTVVVIPQLAHWYLRHDQGLLVIRQLMQWINQRQRTVIIGCHSWAWAYLGKVLGLDGLFPTPHVLAPFNAETLCAWFTSLLKSTASNTVFREASSGKIVFSCGNSNAADTPLDSNFLTHIASHGRGLPEITWSLWRESILRFKQEYLNPAAVSLAREQKEQTVWVPAWTQLALPELPAKPGHLSAFVLHNLLLHAGLPEEYLAKMTPFTRAEIHRGWCKLENAGLIAAEDGRWRVTAAGYPSVRSALKSEGYLIDNL